MGSPLGTLSLSFPLTLSLPLFCEGLQGALSAAVDVGCRTDKAFSVNSMAADWKKNLWGLQTNPTDRHTDRQTVREKDGQRERQTKIAETLKVLKDIIL